MELLLEVTIMFSLNRISYFFFIVCLATRFALGMNLPQPVAVNNFEAHYYTSYNDLVADILGDYHSANYAIQNQFNPPTLSSVAKNLGLVSPKRILRKVDARALSLLGCGNDNLLQTINRKNDGSYRTKTNTGMLQLANVLTNPTDSYHEIKARQLCLQELAHNSAHRKEIRKVIASGLKSYERMIYNLFDQNNELPETQRQLYFQNTLLRTLNTNPTALNTLIAANRVWESTWPLVNLELTVPCMAGLDKIFKQPSATFSILKETGQDLKTSLNRYYNCFNYKINLPAIYKKFQETKSKEGLFSACTNLISSPLSAACLSFMAIGGQKNYNSRIEPGKQEIELYIKAIANLFEVFEKISSFKNVQWAQDSKPDLLFRCTPLTAYKTYGNAYYYLSAKLKEINSTKIFDRLARSGRLLALYKEIANKTYNDWLIHMLKIIGNWDAYCALAEYIADHLNDKDTPVSFAADSPEIYLQDSWNPLSAGNKPVLNTIRMGGKSPRNMLLVAPNSSGKSSIMKDVMISAITNQVGGFVAATEGSQMPQFSLLGSYMNVKEDPSAGLSTGMAQAIGLQELKKMICEEGNKLKLLIIDEPLSGTPEWLAQQFICNDEGQTASLFTMLDLKPNVFSIVATHFKSVNVADKKSFGMYHLQLDQLDGGKTFIPRYTLIAGDHPWWFKDSAEAEQCRQNFARWYREKINSHVAQ